jgi:hypothetical protein
LYVRVAVEMLPALSVAVAVSVCIPTAVPLPVTLQLAIPEVASVAVQSLPVGTVIGK